MYNEQQIIGNVGQIHTRTLDDGNITCYITVASSYSYKDKEGKYVNETEWHRCVSYIQGYNKSLIPKLQVGDMVLVKGRTKTQEYTPKPINGVAQPKRREKIVVLSYIVKFYTKKKKEGDPEYVYNPLSIQPTSSDDPHGLGF